MKYLKSILIALAILLVGSVSVMAAELTPPSYYVESDGSVKPIPDQSVTQIQSGNLTFGASDDSWYWAGGQAGENSSPATASNINLTGSGTINIVVGPNGKPNTAALTITNSDGTNGWTLGTGQTINVYAAADGIGAENNILPYNCFATLNSKTSTPSTALTVNQGGALNIFSGAFDFNCVNANGKGTPGLTVSGGTVNVNGGELEAETDSGTSYQAGANAISITSGALNVNGGLLMTRQGYKPGGDGTTVNNGAGINTTTNGTLSLQNGTIRCSNPAPTTTTGLNGVWISENQNNVKTGTVFGTNATLSTGVYDVIAFDEGGSMSVPSGTTLNVSSNGFWFTNGSTMDIQGTVNVTSASGLWFDQTPPTETLGEGDSNNGGSTLTIGSPNNTSAELDIGATGNVTLGVGTTGLELPSKLQNYGTINYNFPNV